MAKHKSGELRCPATALIHLHFTQETACISKKSIFASPFYSRNSYISTCLLQIEESIICGCSVFINTLYNKRPLNCNCFLGDLSEYARAMEAMDESQEHPKDVARQPQQQQETPAAPGKPYKMKPYTEIVKVQRPEITRKKPSKIGSATYVGRLQTVSQSEVGTARTETTQREREMIYG